VVHLAVVKGVEIAGLETAELQGISEHFGEDVMGVFDVTASLASRNVVGGTSQEVLEGQVKTAEEAII
jgi:argininosuccinate lyase